MPEIYKFRPVLSLIGFCLFIPTILTFIGFRLATDQGLLILFSTFSAIFLFWTTLWGLMGIVELIFLIKKTNKIKTEYKSEQIGREAYRGVINSLKLCFLVNVSYLVIVSFQLWYVISNWEMINV